MDYLYGTYGDILVWRVDSFLAALVPFLVSVGPPIFGMMLLGLYAGRRAMPQNVLRHEGLLRTVAAYGLGLGIAGNTVGLVAAEISFRGESPWFRAVSIVGYAVGGPAFCLFYTSGIVLLAQSEVWRRRLRVFAAAGRMALTNYLFQSLVCTMIFYGYGLGWCGKVGLVLGLGLTAVVFSLQVAVSILWLRSFSYGPVEWLWRMATYGRVLPVRRPGEKPS
jgi:uncharacterized protein